VGFFRASCVFLLRVLTMCFVISVCLRGIYGMSIVARMLGSDDARGIECLMAALLLSIGLIYWAYRVVWRSVNS